MDGMPEGRTFIAVVGAGAGSCGDQVARIAEAVGREIAKAGGVLVCGGLGGVMEAACRGASQQGGLTIGILPTNSRDSANAYVKVAIATGLGEARNALITRTADAVIAIGGEFGTLSEIGLALKMGKPVVGIETWELAKGGQPNSAIRRAGSAEEAVKSAIALALSDQ
jgi:uncharacterized protein (TIGR00725 family)